MLTVKEILEILQAMDINAEFSTPDELWETLLEYKECMEL